MSVSVNGSETVVWKEKERVRIRAVQMDNSSGLLDVRIMYRMQKKQVRKLLGRRKGWMILFSDDMNVFQ